MELTQINHQPAEKQVYRHDDMLEIVDCFPTIQGEGPFVGMPAVFVRLAGCNLQCPSCDTDYTSERKVLSVDEVLTRIKQFARNGLVVITGGEPLRQPLGPLCSRLCRDYKVQVETNGTLYDASLEGWFHHVHLVCSPKTGQVNEKLKPVIGSLKYILQAGKVDEKDGLPLDSLNFGVRPARPWAGFHGEVFVQPLDEQDEERNHLNQQAAVGSCMKFGWRLCLQIHKLLELP